MVDKPKKDKKQQKTVNIAAISARNLAGKGWTAEDFGIPSLSTNLNPATSPAATALGTVNAASSGMTTPTEQATIQKMLTNPDEAKAAEGPVASATSFLAKLFDYSDTQDNPVEWVWDGAWRTLGWGYDRVNQGASWAVSAAPGGIGTFTWDQAGKISYGQAALAAGAENVKEYGPLGQILNMATSPLSPLGGALAQGDMAGPLGRPGFDVTNEAMRKAAFEESTVGKVASGVSDAVFSVVADPLLFAGKFASLAKLRYLDDTFQGSKGLERLRTQFIESAAVPFEQKAPIAQFADLTSRVDDTGKKLLSHRDIATRLKGATGVETLTSALYHNTDPRTAELIIRYAFNDVEAGKELLGLRPSIALAITRKQRERMAAVLARDPQRKNQLAGIAERAEKRLDDQLKSLMPGSDEYNRIKTARDRAHETYAAIIDDKLGDIDNASAMTPEVEALMVREYKDLVSNDRALAKFIGDEEARISTSSNMFAGSTRGFSANNRWGRWVENNRMQRVQAAGEAASTRGALIRTGRTVALANGARAEEMRRVRPWESTTFGGNGFQRAVRVWRWFGEENPSGFVVTKGAGAMDSWKEVRAVLDDVNIYSGDPRRVVIAEETKDAAGKTIKQTREILVGGKERKEQLLAVYMDAVHDTTAGADAAALVLAQVEDAIFSDISAWHGIPKTVAKELQNKALNQRETVLNGLRRKSDEAFWIDENQVKNKAPWLESQIQNGTYMLNYRAFNRLARLNDESGALRTLDSAGQFVGKNAKFAYDLFNEMWRPAVLLRLGYTQRNVAEGLFRSTAYTFSLDPLRNAVTQAGFGVRNAYMKYSLRKAQDKAEIVARAREAGATGMAMPKSFTRWLTREIDARDKKTMQLEQTMAQPGRLIEDTSEEARDFMLAFHTDMEARYIAKYERAAKAGATRQELAEIQEIIDDVRSNVARVSAIKTFTGNTADSINTLTNLRNYKTVLDDSLERREVLNNDLSAARLFQQQGAAKRRVYDGTIEAPDGTVLAAAFNPDTGYADIALSNLSSDGTTRSMSITASDTMQSAIKAYRMKFYTEVTPDDPAYFDGVAVALRQVKSSEIGQMAIDGASADDIAEFLLKTKPGREILQFIISGENRLIRNKSKWETSELFEMNAEAASYVASNVISRYAQLAPDDGLRAYLKTTTIGDEFNGEAVKKFLVGADGKPKYDLQPVVGHIAEEMGVKSVRDTINNITSAGMRWLGTIPEDAFVRAPFYGQRYETVLRQMIDNLQAQVGPNGQISLKEYDILRRSAHRRALKDTKEWMFTIERRTNLGTYGEMFIPFISAAQNSTTTVGRLMWKDPAIAVLMAKIYQAPERMGIKDEEGNLIVPIPHAIIPDGVEEALGLENMKNWKFTLNQFNLIAPQLEEGTLFRFGPTVAVPATLMMQKGFFGMPDVPAPLKAAFGDEVAESIWTTWKSYTFGADASMSPDVWGSLLPATANRIKQLIEKNDNQSYARLYNTLFHAETLKKRGGMRETYPTKDEIQTMTNNLTLLKLIANAGFAFPPQYESNLQPVADEYRRIQTEVEELKKTGVAVGPNEVDRRFVELYGPTLLIAKDLGMSRGYAPASAGMVETAQRYDSLINKVSSDLGDSGDLSVLSMLFSDNANGLFDGSIYAWQLNNNITGTMEKWRQRMTPEEALTADAKNAGWVKYMQFKEQLDARLAQMGLKSYDYAPQLRAERDSFIAQMAADPLYGAWYRDWQEFGSSRTVSTVMMMQSALTDPTFAADHADSPVWQAGKQYLEGRAAVLNALAQSDGDITSMKNQQIKLWWDNFRADLATQVPDWGAFANRYLDGDDNPQNPGVSFGQVMVGGQ